MGRPGADRREGRHDIIRPMLAPEKIDAPVWVDSIPAMEAMAGDLSARERVAVDTESNSLHAYREQVCLVQFSTVERDYLVDPLALPGLATVGGVLSDARIEKVFHAAEYDLICLRRDFDFRVRTLFDTAHAARVLGNSAAGLDSLLAGKFGIELDKRQQKADWGRRPLTAEQIHYARLDTHYLLQLREVLGAELVEAGRWDLALEDFHRMEDVTVPRIRTDDDVLRRLGARMQLSARELTVLGELLAWREGEASKLNRPVYKVVNDEILGAIARAAPAEADGLPILGLSPRQVSIWGEAILAAVGRGMVLPPVQLKPGGPRDDAMIARVEKLKQWRKAAAKELGVESDIALPRSTLLDVARRAPRTGEELAEVMHDSPTRLKQYGEQILKALSG